MRTDQGKGERKMSNNTQAPAKKKNKAGGVFTSIVAVALIAFAGYYLLTNYVLASKHTIVINDKKIDLRSSIDDIEKQGFYLLDGTARVKDLGKSVTRKQIHNPVYYIGIPDGDSRGISTGVSIKVANFNSQNQPLRKCTIYEISYFPEYQDESVKVLIDGRDMSKSSLDEWNAFLKEKGFPFTDKDLEDYKSGKSSYIANTKGNYKYSVSLNSKSKAAEGTNELKYEYSFKCLQITRDVKVKTIFTK